MYMMLIYKLYIHIYLYLLFVRLNETSFSLCGSTGGSGGGGAQMKLSYSQTVSGGV